MSRFFNMDNGFFQVLSRIADLMILNIIFLITCIPIVTIGAAWTALYYVTLKMIRNEESYIVRSYFKSFKENFKQSTIMWLIALVLLVLLFFDYRIVNVMDGTIRQAMLIGLTVVALFLAMILTYLFPLQSKFYNTIKNTTKNALLMSIRHLPQTVIMLVITVAAVLITFFNNWTISYGLLFWILLGFATIALANSWFLVRIFDKYIPKDEEEETPAPDEEFTVPTMEEKIAEFRAADNAAEELSETPTDNDNDGVSDDDQ
ncbi:MAG: YesL family protein [Marvinbryantia sp.]|uniref:YesL family protein n=1 Tax=Marvinbryantia sp. TaxID=2496532 RepID=UPI0025FD9E7F|nr:DUF624 domain-containing protein [uncultured Marvinbryantia sp.]